MRHIDGYSEKYDENIWFGRRPLAYKTNRVSINLLPKYDVSHYSIMIDGLIYQVKSNKGRTSNSKFNIKISRELRRTSLDREFFTWFTSGYSTNKSPEELKRFFEKYVKQHSYSVLPNENKNEINCQTFVRDMFAFATNQTIDQSDSVIVSKMGTILF